MKKYILSIFLALIIGSVALANYFPDIIVTSPDGLWTDVRAYATIDAAITAIGANVRDIYIVDAEVTTALTIPANAHLHFWGSGSIANSGQLTVNTTNISAGTKQIFTGAGDIDFIAGSTVKSSWFVDLDEAFDVTNDDTLTMIISEAATTDDDMEVGDNVSLRWESPFIITVAAADTVSNIKNIEAGNYQILAGAGDFDFLDGTVLKLDWFNRLRSVLTWVETENVTIVVSGSNLVDFSDAVAANEHIDLLSEHGEFTISGGVTLTVYNPEIILAGKRQQIFTGAGDVTFSNPGIIYSNWWDGDIDDGVTAADVVFQEAIDAAAAGSEIIVLPADSYYNLTDELTIDKALHFHGVETSLADIRQATGAKSGILITESEVEIDHLMITGTQYAAQVVTEFGIAAYGVDKNNYISDINIHDCIVQEFGYSGIVMGSFVENFKVNNNKVLNIFTHGIITRSANYGEIAKNKVYNVIAGGGAGIAYGIVLTVSAQDNTDYPVSSHIKVIGNTVDTCSHEAIGSHYGNNLIFSDNIIINSIGGLSAQSSAANDAASNITMSGNVIRRGAAYSATEVKYGLTLFGTVAQPGTNNVIIGNTIDGFGDQDAAMAVTPSAAVEIRQQVGVVVKGNNVQDSGRIGMFYRSITGLNASGNVIDTVSGTAPVKATGTITFANNPGNGETITINGAPYTFVDPAAPATDYEIDIKASLALTLDEIIAILNAANGQVDAYPTDGRVSTATYTENGVNILTITYDYPGRNGNYFLIAASADTPSGASLAGGEVGSSAVVFNKLAGGLDSSGKMSNEMITVGATYAGIITEPDVDIVDIRFDNIQITGAGCDYDLGGSAGGAPNEATNHIANMGRVSLVYDLPSINQDSSYTFYVPFDGSRLYTVFEFSSTRSNLGIVYNFLGRSNYIEVAAWNFSGGAINAGSQSIFITPSLLK